MTKTFSFDIKIYYEDTDAGGVVYYSNYLKFLERARSEAIYTLGLSNTKIKKIFGIIIVVKSCNIEYKKPAKTKNIFINKECLKVIVCYGTENKKKRRIDCVSRSMFGNC